MAKIEIDGRTVEAADGSTVLAAAERAGISIPHFCHHPNLAPEGTCRMCVVEIAGAVKLEPSCATIVREGMKIVTASPRIADARRSVLELLLADHPIDCPICDKAGECRLQDYCRDYGLSESAFGENKTRREKLFRIGDRLLLDRERCVLCTRCVRFLRDVAKTGELGVFERGGRTEIGIFEGIPVSDGYSGNLVDLCPVGAITDTAFRFKTRTWFLEPKPSVCPYCARGCLVDVDIHPGFARHPETGGILRVRPRPDATPAGPWICDIGRYAWIETESRRVRRIVWNKEDREAVLSGDRAFALLGARLRALAETGKGDRLTLVLHSGLTNEEWTDVAEFLGEFAGRPRVRIADPVEDDGDGFLRTSERTPNRRGAAASGVEILPFHPEDDCPHTDLLIVFAGIRGHLDFLERCRPAWSGIAAKALVSPVLTAADRDFDFVFPCAIPYEKSGSYINCDGRRLEFSAVRPAPDEVKAEGEILRLLRAEVRRTAEGR